METSNSPRLAVLADGKVGIGTTTPLNALDVVGAVSASGAVSSGGSISATNNVSAGANVSAGNNLSVGNNATALNVYATNSLGVGTTAPARMLEVAGVMRVAPSALPGTPGAGDVAIDAAAGNALKYYNGSSWISLAVGGTGDFKADGSVAMTGAFRSTGGNASAPGMTFVGDTANGVFAPTTNTFGVSTAGQERLRVTPAGFVGIGTSAPTSALTVAGNITPLADGTSTVGTSALRYNTLYGRMVNAVGNTLGLNGSTVQLQTGGTDRVIVDAGGNVGIGTTSPNRLLEVSGPIRIAATALPGSAAAGDVAIDSGASNTLKYHNGTNWISLGTGNTTSAGTNNYVAKFNGGNSIVNSALYESGGNVGVGTTAPATALDVNGAVRSTTAFQIGGANNSLNQPTANQLALTTNSVERLRIDGSGNVGIGTTAPLEKLHVAGSARFDSNISLSEFQGNVYSPNAQPYLLNMTIGNSRTLDSTGSMVVLSARNTAGDTQSAFVGAASNSSGYSPTLFFMQQSGAASYAERMRIGSTGNVGIGTTSPNRLLSVNGLMNVAPAALPGSPNAGDIAIDSGGGNSLKYHNGTNWISLAVGGTGDFKADGSVAMTGAFRSIGGTAGAPGMTFVGDTANGAFAPTTNTFGIATSGAERFRITPAGNIGVGTTAAGQKLSVAGGITVDAGALNTGTISNALIFGGDGDGEAIGSKRTAGGNNYGLDFYTASQNRMAITVGGNVGIGTSSPSRLLSVNGLLNVAPTALPGTPAAGDLAIDSGAGNSLKYHNGTSWISLAVGGTGDFKADGSVNMTGTLKHLQGTAGAPGLTFAGDTDNGIFAPVADNLAFGTSATERMRILANGNVGIGTSAPGFPLDVNGTINGSSALRITGNAYVGIGSSNAPAYAFQSNTNSGMYSPSANQLGFSSNGAERMRFDAAGNVGIGTTSPNRLLEVAGTVRFAPSALPGTAAAGDLAIDSGAGNSLKYHNGTNWISLAVGGTGDFKADGSVNMTGTLKHLQGTAGAPGLTFAGDTDNGIFAPVADNLAFGTSGAERMRILANGNVGIGVSAPSNALSVAGVISATADITSPKFSISGTGTTPANGMYAPAANNLALSTNTAERMRIDSSGNVGIGTTSPSRMLEVAGAIRVTPTTTPAGGAAGDLFFDTAASNGLKYHNGTNWVVLGSGNTASVGTANYISKFNGTNSIVNSALYDSGGLIGIGTTAPQRALHVASSGAATIILDFTSGAADQKKRFINTGAGGALNFGKFSDDMTVTTYQMSLDNSGNVGIGTTVPNRLLEVAGAVRFAPSPLPGTGAAGDIAIDSGAGNSLKYHNGTNWISLAVGGTGDFKADGSVNMTGMLKHLQGTAGAPGLTFAGDTDNGIFAPVADNLAFGTSGAERIRILANGNVGIGTTNPTSPLDVNGNMRATGYIYAARFNGAEVYGSNSVSGNLLLESTTSATKGYVFLAPSGGNVGIGTTSPSRILEVAGPVRITPTVTPASANAGDLFFDSAASNGLKYHNGSNWISLGTGNTTSAGSNNFVAKFNGSNSVINSAIYETAGNVGIGTTAPGTMLDVAGGLRFRDIGSLYSTSYGGGIGYLGDAYGNGGTSDATTGQTGLISNTNLVLAATNAQPIVFRNVTGFRTGSELMRITSGGNVGIGTTGPVSEFHVVGANGLPSLTSDAGNIQTIESNTTVELAMGQIAGGSYPFWLQAKSTQNVGTSYPLVLNPVGGNVGIGTTSPNRSFEVAGSVRFAPAALPGSGAAGDIAIDSGAGNSLKYHNGTNWISLAVGGTGDFKADGSVAMTGQFRSTTGNAGAPGMTFAGDTDNGIFAPAADNLAFGTSATEKMRILANGNVGIGTTNPSSSLHILANTSSGWATQVENSNTGAPAGGLYINSASGGATSYPLRVDSQGGINRFIVTGSGNVGIGVTAPNRLLQVAGAVRISPTTTPSSAGAGDLFFDSGSGNTLKYYNGSNWVSSGAGDFMADGSINMTGSLKHLAGGTAGAPSLTFAGDTDNGIFAPTADNLAFATFATEKMRIIANGNVGIGTSAPGTKLDVSSMTLLASSEVLNGRFAYNMGKGVGLGYFGDAAGTNVSEGRVRSLSNSNLSLGTSSFPQSIYLIDATGYVGVGTTSPNRLLEVAGSVRFAPAALPGSGAAGDIAIDSGAGNSLKYHNGTNWISLAVGGTGDFKADGSVSMTGTLKHLQGTAAAPGMTFNGDTDNGIFAPVADNLAFGTSGAERMRILANGNVGIGSSNPLNALDVVGSMALSGSVQIGASALIMTSVSAGTNITAGNNITANGTIKGPNIYATSNLGVGTTAPARLLEVAGVARFTPTVTPGSTGAGDLFFDSAAANSLKYFNGSNWVTVGNGTGNTTSTGTANYLSKFNGVNSIGNSALYESAGNVGIGMTAPNRLLQVAGAVRISPTATPGSAGAGDLFFDSGAGNTLKYYNGSNWVSAGAGDFMADGSINMTGALKHLAGTAAAPGITFAGDTDNGIFAPAADNLAFGTSATERMRILANGFVGVGTSSPGSVLDVNGGVAIGYPGIAAPTNGLIVSGRLGIGVTSIPTSSVILAEGNLTQIYDGTSMGNVGMTVSNRAPADGNSSWLNLQAVSSSTGMVAGSVGLVAGSGYNSSLVTVFKTGASSFNERMRVTSAGNVGIGTTNPNRLLEVAGALRVSPTTTPGSAAAGDLFFDSAASNGLKYYNGSNWVMVGNGTGNTTSLGTTNYLSKFNGVNSIVNSGLYETSGNVGIGMTSPNRLLQVAGAVRISPTATPASAGAGDLFFDSGAGNTLKYYNGSNWVSSGAGDFMADGSINMTGALKHLAGTAAAPGITFAGDTDNGIFAPAADNLAFGTSATERMRILANGYVGIGSSAPVSPLTITGTARQTAAGYYYNQYNSMEVVPSSTSSANTYASLFARASTDSSNVGSASILGAEISAHVYNGTGTLPYVGGTSSVVSNYSGRTINSVIAMEAASTSESAATINFATGVQARVLQNAGTIGTAYGVSIPSVQGTNKWSIWASDGSAPSYFAAGVGIGTTAPSRLLQVAGAMKLSPSILPGSPTAGDLFVDSAGANTLKYHNGTTWVSLAASTGGDFKADGSVPMTGAFRSASGGNAATPGITFAGDTDNGIFAPVADNLAFGTSATERMRILPNGFVGIGTTAPATQLEVRNNQNTDTILQIGNWNANSGASAGLNLAADTVSGGISAYGSLAGLTTLLSSNSNLDLRSGTGNVMRFATNGAIERMRIDSTGRVGIGMTAPNRLLQVAGAVRITPTTTPGSAGAGDLFVDSGSGNTLKYYNGSNWVSSGAGDFMADGSVNMTGALKHLAGTAAAPGLTFAGDTDNGIFAPVADSVGVTTSGIERMRVLSNGNIGIGTTSPVNSLTVQSSTGITATNSSTGALELLPQAANNILKWYGSSNFSIANDGAFANRGNGSSGNVLFSMTTAGNVGIGITAPNRLLQVAGPIRVTPTVTPGSAAAGDLFFDSAAANSLKYHNGSTWQILATGSGSQWSNNASDIYYNLGKVGIGTSAPSDLLDVTANANTYAAMTIRNQNAGASASAIVNVNSDAVNAQLVSFSSTSGNNTLLQTNGSSLNLRAYNAGGFVALETGAGGTERMRVTASGNVGIGTTSPSRLLQVAGPMKLSPVAIPSTPTPGDMLVDSGGGNSLKYYNGSTWVQVGNGTGNTTSTGTANYISKFNGVNSIVNSAIFENSGAVSIGTSNPQSNFHVHQSGGGFAQLQITNDDTTSSSNNVGFRFGLDSNENATISVSGTKSLFLGTNNTDRVFIDPNGNVGIGASGPTRMLQVGGVVRFNPSTTPGIGGAGDIFFDSAASNSLKYFNGSSWITVGNGTGNTTSAGTANYLTRFNGTNSVVNSSVYESAGNVGIGTTAPLGRRLTVDGDGSSTPVIGISNTGSGNGLVQMSWIGNANSYSVGVGQSGEYILGLANKWFLRDEASNATRLVVDTSGNVGIGVTGPTARLEVAGIVPVATGANTLATSNSNAAAIIHGTTDSTAGIRFSQGVGIPTMYLQNTNSTGTGVFDIALNPFAGNVGIGLTTPNRLLQVAGAIRLTPTPTPGSAAPGDLFFDSAASNTLKYHNGSNWISLGTGSGGDFKADGSVNMTGQFDSIGGTAALPGMTFVSDTNTGIFSNVADNVGISTAGVERMRVLADGKVGIGTSNSANLLQVNEGVATADTVLGAFTQPNAGNLKTSYIFLGRSQTPNDGALIGYTHNTTPANRFIEFSHYGGPALMTITNAGNVGIGTTAATRLLQVAGAMKLSPAAIPGSATAGDMVVDAGGANVLKYYNGTTWVAIAASLGGDFKADGSVAMTGAFRSIGTTAAAPAMTFVGDTDNGIFAPAADNLAFGTSGNERMRILANGFVGIGLSVPTATFEVNGMSKFPGGTSIDTFGNVSAQFGGSVRVDSAGGYNTPIISLGNTGSGTGATVYKDGFYGFSSAATIINGAGLDSAFYRLGAGKVGLGTSNNGSFNGTFITGNIGVGTSSPTRLLQVAGAMKLSPSAIPGTPTPGDIVVDSGGGNTLKYYNGTAWVSSGAGDFMANGSVIMTGQFDSISGTALLPGMTFGTDTNTGIFNPAADNVGIATSGIERLRILANGRVGIGTSTPGYGLDVNTAVGITGQINQDGNFFNYGSDVAEFALDNTTSSFFQIKNGNTPVLRLPTGTSTGAGNLGIGTTTPTRLLHVAGPMRLSPAAIPGSAAPGDIVVDSGGGNTLKYYNGTTWVTASSTGSGLPAANGTMSAPSINFTNSTGMGLYRQAADTLGVSTAGVNRMTIDSSGQVGIGTTSPGYLLHVQSPGYQQVTFESATDSFQTNFQSYGTGKQPTLFFNTARGTKSSPAYLQSGDSSGYIASGDPVAGQSVRIQFEAAAAWSGASTPGNILFQTTPTASTVPTTRMSIAADGKVAVGNITATRLFQVDGAMKLTPVAIPGSPTPGDIVVDSGGGNTLKYYNGTTWVASGAGDFMANGSINMTGTLKHLQGTAASPGLTFAGDTDNGIFAPVADNLAFGTSAAERMRILANGNVGIGTSTASRSLEIKARAGSTTPFVMTTNDYAPGTTGSGIAFDFGTASGNTYTALTPINSGGATFGNLVLLGNVGFGTTSPSRQLHVAGPMKLSPAAIPGSPTPGDIVIDSGGGNTLKYYNGTTWVNASSTGAGLPAADGTVATPSINFTNSTGMGLYRIGADNLGISTAGANRLAVTASGTVGIGTTAPGTLLDVVMNGTGSSLTASPVLRAYNSNATQGDGSTTFNIAQVRATAGNGAVFGSLAAFYNSNLNGTNVSLYTNGTTPLFLGAGAATVTNPAVTIISGGYVGIGTTAPSVALDVVGDIEYTGTITDVSDRRLKENITPLNEGLAMLRELPVYSYTMKGDEKQRVEYGVMAQDLRSLVPNLTSIIDPKNGYIGVNYIGLIPWSIRAIQEVDREVASVKAENAELKTRVDKLEQQNKFMMEQMQKLIDLQERNAK